MVAVFHNPPYLLMTDVSWDYYWHTRHEFDAAVRITYDSGRMEIMTPMSAGHEGKKKILARLIEIWALERDVPLTGLGGLTLTNAEFAKGAEPDECYYLETEPPPLERSLVDLSIHSPPDLAVEIDLSSLSIDKEPIYAAFGVPELWRWEKEELRIRRLRADGGGYDDVPRSVLLPDFPVEALAEHMRLGGEMSQHEILKRWRGLVGGR